MSQSQSSRLSRLLLGTLVAGLTFGGSARDASAYEEALMVDDGYSSGGGSSTTTTTSTTTRPSGLVTVYIHGRTKTTGTFSSYWQGVTKGSNPRTITWAGTKGLSSSVGTVATQLDSLCKGPAMPCNVVCHSAGCLMMGRQLANNPGRWNIGGVIAVAGAQGGSDLVETLIATPGLNLALMVFGQLLPIDFDLIPNVSRGMYNHDQTSNVPFRTMSGKNSVQFKKCKWYQLGCHLSNAGILVLKIALKAIYRGNAHDTALGVDSTAGFRSRSTFTKYTCAKSRWTNYSSVVCHDGYKMSHNELPKFITAMPNPDTLLAPPAPAKNVDDCQYDNELDRPEDEGTCNSFDDYGRLKYSSGLPINYYNGGQSDLSDEQAAQEFLLRDGSMEEPY